MGLIKLGIEFIFIFLLLVVSVYSESDLQYQTFDIKLKAGVDLNYLSEKSRLDYFNADLSFYPRNYFNQEVLDLKFTSEPNANIEMGENIGYKWKSLEDNKLNYGFDAKVKVKTLLQRVDKKIDFPGKHILEENAPFTKPTKYVDINQDIKDKANEIVKGDDDLYSATVDLAEWIRGNVKYDMTTLTESVVQKSSWVLENKYGVCDEITNLFISFLRSLNIPARYVIGVAFTDYVKEGWAPHAWAEVYFDGYGWIPFDITFGQYGWVDSGHIKFDDSLDSQKPSVGYNWKAIKVDIANKRFDLESSLIEKGEKIMPFVDLKVRTLGNRVGRGSYVPVEVIVKNLQPYYLAPFVYLTNAPSVDGDSSKAVLLKPLEEKKLYWVVKVQDDLDNDYVYKSDIVIQNNFGARADTFLDFGAAYPVLSEEYAYDMIKKEKENWNYTKEEILEPAEEKKEETWFKKILNWLF